MMRVSQINNINQKEIFVLQTAVIVAINFFYLISTVYTKYDAAWTVYTKYGVPPAPQLHWYLYPCHSTFWIPRSTAANNFTQDWITYIFETSPYKNEGECIFIFEGDQNEKLNFQLEDLKIYVNVTTSKECMKLYSVEKTADIKFLFSICNSEIHGNNIITGNFTTNANIGIITTTIEYGYFRIKVRSMYEKNENQTSSSTTELTTLANNLTTVSTAATDTDSTSTEADSIKRP